MTTLNAELYDALIAIKVPEDKARAAAEAYMISNHLATKAEVAELKAEMRMMGWIGGILFAAVIALQIAHMTQ